MPIYNRKQYYVHIFQEINKSFMLGRYVKYSQTKIFKYTLHTISSTIISCQSWQWSISFFNSTCYSVSFFSFSILIIVWNVIQASIDFTFFWCFFTNITKSKYCYGSSVFIVLVAIEMEYESFYVWSIFK